MFIHDSKLLEEHATEKSINTNMTNIFNYHLLVVFTADLLATSGDITFSWTSPIYPKLYSNDTLINPLGRPITPNEDSWISSLLNIGCIIGSLPYGYISGKFGRKIGLLSVGIPHIISFTVMAYATDVYSFYFARFLGGMALGGGYTLLPMYISEISEDANRGAMSLTLSVFWAIGSFLPYAIGPYLTIYYFNLVLALIPAAFFLLFLVLGCESPYYLVEVGRIEEAEKSLMLLRSLGKHGIQGELHSIQAYLKMTKDGHFSDIIKEKALRKAFMVCLVLIATQELSGISVISNHLQSIFESTGTNMAPEISALIVGFLFLLSSFIAPFLVDRAGRRPLTIWSCLGMFTSLTMLGSFFYLQDTYSNIESINWMPIFSLIFYIVSFNLGICSMPWVLASELFPSKVKRVALAALSIFGFSTSFFTTKTFNDMGEWIGKSGTFWLFAACCLSSAIFCIALVPETKGKSFSEIRDMMTPPKESNKMDEVELMLIETGNTSITAGHL